MAAIYKNTGIFQINLVQFNYLCTNMILIAVDCTRRIIQSHSECISCVIMHQVHEINIDYGLLSFCVGV